ncbi:MAG: hypothetical protein ACM3NR_01910 [Methanosarcina sp.]
MKKAAIKSKVYIGFTVLIVISIFLFGTISWFAKDYILEGAKIISYNSSLARQMEGVRELSDEKINTIYKSILGKTNVSEDIEKSDKAIDGAWENILSGLSSFYVSGSDKAALDAKNMTSSIIKEEDVITETYNTSIAPTVEGDDEEKYLSSVNETIDSWEIMSTNISDQSQKVSQQPTSSTTPTISWPNVIPTRVSGTMP